MDFESNEDILRDLMDNIRNLHEENSRLDVSPVTISLATITIYMFLPQRFHDWIAK